MAFGITEPDAGSNSHNITTTARRDGDDWVLNGRKIYISGVDEAEASSSSPAPRTPGPAGSSRRCSSCPTDAAGLRVPRRSTMEIVSPEKQFLLFLDDVRLPADALVGDEDAGLVQLFAGLNPERIMAAAVLDRHRPLRARQGRRRTPRSATVWGAPIGAHQGIAHPLAQVEDRARAGPADDAEGGGALRRRRRHGRRRGGQHGQVRRGRGRRARVDQAVQTHGGNGLTQEYGLAALLVAARVGRIAPVSREMILNFVAQFSLGPAQVLLIPRREGRPMTERSCTTPSTAAIATITLDSPANRNALSAQLVGELARAPADGRRRRRGARGRAHPHRHDVLRRRRPQGADRPRAVRQTGTGAHARAAAQRSSSCPSRWSPGSTGMCAPAASASSAPATSRSPGQDATFAFTEVRLGLGAGDHLADHAGRMTDRARQPLLPHRRDVRRGGGRRGRAGHRGGRRTWTPSSARSSTRCARARRRAWPRPSR